MAHFPFSRHGIHFPGPPPSVPPLQPGQVYPGAPGNQRRARAFPNRPGCLSNGLDGTENMVVFPFSRHGINASARELLSRLQPGQYPHRRRGQRVKSVITATPGGVGPSKGQSVTQLI